MVELLVAYARIVGLLSLNDIVMMSKPLDSGHTVHVLVFPLGIFMRRPRLRFICVVAIH